MKNNIEKKKPNLLFYNCLGTGKAHVTTFYFQHKNNNMISVE